LYNFFAERTTPFFKKVRRFAMNAVGIVAEYNPFHAGHAYHMAETRRLLGEDRPIVCAMSGSWVQRGECALTDKWTRAALALRGGADLVLELPLPWAISSAEGFARGAAVLKATGVVDTLSFGSESGDLEGLRQVARGLEGEAYQAALREELGKGLSFADARQRAALRAIGRQAETLRGANDNLAVEYLRAAGEDLDAVAVVRKGADHDSGAPGEGFASASLVRELARRGDWEGVARWTPAGTAETLQKAGVANMKYVERAFLARLRSMTAGDFAALPDSDGAGGLPERLVRAARRAGSMEEFYAMAKTKRYAHARLRRLALWAFLGLTVADRPAGGPACLRVLGMNGRGQALLHEMGRKAALPVLTKPAHVRKLGEEAQRQFALECKATDLYSLCFDSIRPCGMDYTTGPVIL